MIMSMAANASPQLSKSDIRKSDLVESIEKDSVTVTERQSSDSKSRRSRPTSTLSRGSQIKSPQSTIKEKMAGSSSESMRPLRNNSEKSSGGETLVVKPDPIYTRSGRSSFDPEKQEYNNPQQNPTPGFTPTVWPIASPSQPSTTSEWNCEYVPYTKPGYEDHLGLILVYLSTLNPLIAMTLSFYTLATVSCIAIIAPLSLCTKQGHFSSSVITSISPALRLQLRLIYSTPVASTGESATRVAWSAILAPFYAVAIAFAAWVAAAFWCFAAILGEPNERHGKEQDGRAAIRAVRRLWERWLLWGLC